MLAKYFAPWCTYFLTKFEKNIQKQLSEIPQNLENETKSYNTIATGIIFGTKPSIRISYTNMKYIVTNMTQILGAHIFSIKSLFQFNKKFNKKVILLFLRHYHRVVPAIKRLALMDLKMEGN